MLKFVSRGKEAGEWEARDLDIYCPLGQSECIVALFEAEGYKAAVVPAGDGFDRPYVDETFINCVVRMHHRDRKQVDIVVSACYSALSPIARFYATHVVNIVTASSVCVAYPNSTFKRKAFLRPWASRTVNRARALEKYKERGYRLVAFAENDEARVEAGIGSEKFYCPHEERSFGDEGTVRLWLGEDTNDLTKDAEMDLMTEVKWRWGGRRCTCCTRYSVQDIRIRKRIYIEMGSIIGDLDT